MVLEKLGHADDITREVNRFFEEFPGAKKGTVGEKVLKRLERARSGKLRSKRPKS
jgi:hypothetical protein